ncbi:hypothetical protein MycrhDRAFT_1606 [Mycolicibacterium rhodesiae JS60]|nr:hypothetical protein MycrhDRAFT_1606 [Mycolicibacterium rhodesiae JS60]
MNRRNQLMSVHVMGVFVVVLGGGLLLAGWVPPPSPNLSDSEIAAIFRVGNGDVTRMVFAAWFFFAPCFAIPMVAVANQMRRIEGPSAALATNVLLMAPVGVLGLQIPAALWLAAGYRPGLSDAAIVTMNDIAWFFILGAVGPGIVQMLSVVLCILQGDGSIYPRWLGYTILWLAPLELASAVIMFFKTGPLAWDGLLSFWVVAAGFFAWAVLIWIFTARAINRMPDETPAQVTAPQFQ